MISNLVKISPDHPENSTLDRAVALLRGGGIVAFPTETVYGLGADAKNADAVARVFRVKGRPADNPLIVHLASPEHVSLFALQMPEKGKQLARRFWPGPLTLVVRSRPDVPRIVRAGLDTVALRVPDHPVTLELLRRFDGGIVGPSANLSGKPSPTSAEHVAADLGGNVDMILDAGPTRIGLESTVLDITGEIPIILRIGGLSREELEREIGAVLWTTAGDLLKRSPGTRHRHYAPNARVILFRNGDGEELRALLRHFAGAKNIGMITHSESLSVIEKTPNHIALKPSVEYFARNIFRALRDLDRNDAAVILVESVPEEGLGAAVMDRLRRAAAAPKEEDR